LPKILIPLVPAPGISSQVRPWRRRPNAVASGAGLHSPTACLRVALSHQFIKRAGRKYFAATLSTHSLEVEAVVTAEICGQPAPASIRSARVEPVRVLQGVCASCGTPRRRSTRQLCRQRLGSASRIQETHWWSRRAAAGRSRWSNTRPKRNGGSGKFYRHHTTSPLHPY
jgi:hypothetical protein